MWYVYFELRLIRRVKSSDFLVISTKLDLAPGQVPFGSGFSDKPCVAFIVFRYISPVVCFWYSFRFDTF